MFQIVYLIVAASTWYYPNPDEATSNGGNFVAALLSSGNLSSEI